MKIVPVLLAMVYLTLPDVSARQVHTEVYDLRYVDEAAVTHDSLQRLNLVIPATEEAPPLLMWIGGGAWAYGDRDTEMELAGKFADAGIAVASVGHRLSPAVWKDSSLVDGVQHPAHIQDIAAAFKWLYDNAHVYDFDQERMFVGGYSSGAHLAALLSLDARYLDAEGLTPAHIRGIVPIAGAYDIPAYHQAFLEGSRPELAQLHVEAVFGESMNQMAGASPTSYLDAISVPILLISEQGSYNYTRIFEAGIQDTGFEAVSVIHVRDMGHAEFWRHLSRAETSAYRDRITAFIQSSPSALPR